MNKKLILALIATGAIVGTSFAMYGQGRGQSNGMGQGQGQGMHQGKGNGLGQRITAEERAKLQSLPQDQRMQYAQELRQKYGLTQGKGMGQGQQQNQTHDPSAMINQYPASTITDELRQDLINQYGEEKLAHDLYQYAYEKYGTQVFANIVKSETQHMTALKALLDRYGIPAPTDYAADNELYTQLKAKIDEGLEQALNVGVIVETTDIKDIAADAKDAYDANAKDLLAVYTNIAGGSYNHLKGFLQALKMYGYNLPDVSEYLPDGVTVDQLLSMRGPDVKALFPEYVKQTYGIDLSEYSCNKQNQQNMRQRGKQSQANGNRMQPSVMQNQTQAQVQTRTMALNGNIPAIAQKYVNPTKVNQYKLVIAQKYANKIDSLTEDKIQTIITKIDTLLEKIANSTTYTDTQKEVITNVLVALKEILLQKLNSTSDSILNDLLGE